MKDRWVRFFHTVRYVRPRQLFWRLFLTLKRKWMVANAELYRARLLNAPLPRLELETHLPAPVFRQRKKCELDNGTYTICFLNESRTFHHPFDWSPPELKTGTRLWLLNLHYMEFLESLPDQAFQDVIQDWVDSVPPFRSGYWLDEWNSYALSIRCVVWMQQYERRCQQVPEKFRAKLLTSLFRQLRFLAANLEHDIGGNHLIKNIKALLWAGSFFRDPVASRWRTLGEHLLRGQLAEQILLDGVHYERSPAYHAQVFADLLECFSVVRAESLKATLRVRLEKMAQALHSFTHPDGKISLFNDGGLNMAYSPAECLEAWRSLCQGKPIENVHIHLPDSGYFGHRKGGDYLLVDCGRIAPDFLMAHGHGDILAFEWSVSGERIVIDAGVYEYNPGPNRDYSRSTSAHNTLTLDNQDQCEFWGAFRVARRADVRCLKYLQKDDGFSFAGSHNGYARLQGQPIHNRGIEYTVGELKVVDEVTGGSGQLAVARLLIHPDCTISMDDTGLTIARGKTRVRLNSPAAVRVVDAAWFPDFGREVPGQQIEISYGVAPCKGSFTLTRVN